MTFTAPFRRLSLFIDTLKLYLHRQIKKNLGRDTDIVYYDVTNYYFEIDKQDEFMRKSVSKEQIGRASCRETV